jgi:hypothetical protein
MRNKVFVILSLLVTVLLCESRAAASCFCVSPRIAQSLKKSASVFIGRVTQISGPREVRIGDRTEQLYVVKFFVWERWKGAEGLEVEILSTQKENVWCFEYPALKIGETHLIFADPIDSKDVSANVEGIVNGCSNSTRLIGPGPEFEINGWSLYPLFELDSLTRPQPAQIRTGFRGPQLGPRVCMIC